MLLPPGGKVGMGEQRGLSAPPVFTPTLALARRRRRRAVRPVPRDCVGGGPPH
jgi:hypothetical protein